MVCNGNIYVCFFFLLSIILSCIDKVILGGGIGIIKNRIYWFIEGGVVVF